MVIQSLGVGGAERQAAALASGLHQRGHAVRVAALRRGDGPLSSSLETDGVPLHVLTAPSGGGVLAAAVQLARIARQQSLDVVHGYMPVGNLLALSVRVTCPDVKVVFGVRSSRLDLRHYPLRTRITEGLSHRLAARADLIIANSESGAAYSIAAGSAAARTVVVPNGIDTRRFVADPDARSQTRAALGIGSDDPVVGMIARLDPMKDHATFLGAAQLLLPDFPNARFLCIGGGDASYRRKLEALAASLGVAHAVMWLGQHQDTRGFLNAMDVATHTSSFGEGFPNAVGEAMACERVCVVTDVGDAKLVVGDAGVIVPPRNPAALAGAWAQVLRAAGTGLGARARTRIAAHYSVAHLVGRTEELLLGVLRHPRQP